MGSILIVPAKPRKEVDVTRFTEPTLNTCIQTVIDVSHATKLRLPNDAIGNLVRVHLGQAVLMSLVPRSMPEVLRAEPLQVIGTLPGPGGHRERMVRCTRLGRQFLLIYSLTPECRDHQVNELAYAGRFAYRLAADEAASYDRWYGELLWDISQYYVPYGNVIATSHHILARSN